MTKTKALDILKLQPGSTIEKVKTSFRKMAIKSHPDKGGDIKSFIAVRQAHDYLVEHGTTVKPKTVTAYEPFTSPFDLSFLRQQQAMNIQWSQAIQARRARQSPFISQFGDILITAMKQTGPLSRIANE